MIETTRHIPAAAPVLVTARLHLRAPTAADIPGCTAFFMSERSRFMGGPLPEPEAAAEGPALLSQWETNGFGMFAICLKGSDTAIGLAGPWYPKTHPEPELGWNLWQSDDEGHGLAREALVAARGWFFANTTYASAVSYTHPENLRSHHLAEAVGAVLDPTAPCPYPPPVRIYRHLRGQA
ncbi:MAG: hypothetical protein RIR95_527 [Pseudomonadota bacterium]